jgi:hypothetical protein
MDVLATEWMPRYIGMEFTIYDPTHDPGGGGADLIVNMLAELFSKNGET